MVQSSGVPPAAESARHQRPISERGLLWEAARPERSSMSSAKQRGNKSSSNLSPSEKGAHSNHPDDVARKQQQQQQQSQAPSKGSKGGRSSSPTAAATSSSSRSSLGKVFSFLFYLAFLAVAVFAGWAAHHLLEEVNQISLRQEGYNQQREQMTHTLEGVMQKVRARTKEESFVSLVSVYFLKTLRAALSSGQLPGTPICIINCLH